MTYREKGVAWPKSSSPLTSPPLSFRPRFSTFSDVLPSPRQRRLFLGEITFSFRFYLTVRARRFSYVPSQTAISITSLLRSLGRKPSPFVFTNYPGQASHRAVLPFRSSTSAVLVRRSLGRRPKRVSSPGFLLSASSSSSSSFKREAAKLLFRPLSHRMDRTVSPRIRKISTGHALRLLDE